MTRKEHLEKRAEIIAKARQINDEHSVDGILPAEHQEQFDNAMAKAGEHKAAADRIGALEDAEASLSQPAAPAVIPGDPTSNHVTQREESLSVRSNELAGRDGQAIYAPMAVGPRGQAEYREAFSSFLRGGQSVLSPEQFSALRSDDADQAGYLVASEQFASELLKAVDDIVQIRRYARVHTVRDANSLGIRKRTAKAATFGWSSELEVSAEDTTLAFGKKVLTPHHLTGQIVVSRDLVRRAVMSADMIVREELARDGGEVQEQAFLTGTGDQQPLGVFTPSTDGISTARDVLTGSATDFTADQLVAAKYTLKQQYRNGGERSGARWMFHRDGISKIAQLKDGDNHYMLQPARGLTGDEFDTLLGHPVDESEFAPNTFTTGQYVGILAQWRYYEIADALDMEVQVLTELLARTNQIAYIARMKTDGLPTLEEAFVRLKTS